MFSILFSDSGLASLLSKFGGFALMQKKIARFTTLNVCSWGMCGNETYDTVDGGAFAGTVDGSAGGVSNTFSDRADAAQKFINRPFETFNKPAIGDYAYLNR
jgi:hypothetical protein